MTLKDSVILNNKQKYRANINSWLPCKKEFCAENVFSRIGFCDWKFSKRNIVIEGPSMYFFGEKNFLIHGKCLSVVHKIEQHIDYENN